MRWQTYFRRAVPSDRQTAPNGKLPIRSSLGNSPLIFRKRRKPSASILFAKQAGRIAHHLDAFVISTQTCGKLIVISGFDTSGRGQAGFDELVIVASGEPRSRELSYLDSGRGDTHFQPGEQPGQPLTEVKVRVQDGGDPGNDREQIASARGNASNRACSTVKLSPMAR